jgi:hypothetical protein
MFDNLKSNHFIIAIVIVAITAYLGNQLKERLDTTEQDEYEMIKKYLLNDSPLYGYNKPKIWIHSKYEVNARSWTTGQGLNTTDLNQPYLHTTIQSIINQCGNDFHICLIDDATFSKLIPSWEIDLPNIAEPFKTQYRELGLLELVYYYGGIIVPNSFLCLKPLKPIYDSSTAQSEPFICEKINRSTNIVANSVIGKRLFMPDIGFIGAKKNNETVLEIIKTIKTRSQNPHFTNEYEFLGDTDQLALSLVEQNKMTIIGGEVIGIKSNKKKPIRIEELLEEAPLDIDDSKIVGIYIPADEILRRPKYEWFAVMDTDYMLKSNLAIVKYMKLSLSKNEFYQKSTEVKSVIAI